MTETANVVLAQSVYRAFGRRDIPSVLAALSEEVEWGEPDNPLNPSGGTRHGHAGVLEWVRIGSQAEEILALEPRHFLSGGDMVAVIGYTKCRVRATGRTLRDRVRSRDLVRRWEDHAL
jgi:ketosteroid isomerase-like protein